MATIDEDPVNAVTWLILTFYAPALWVSLALLVWQLVVRQSEGVTAAPSLPAEIGP